VRAVQFDRFGPPEVLTLGSLPAPHPGPDEVRIAVKAAGVTPVDLALRAGLSSSSKQLSLPHIPGVDAAGVIDELGANVTGYALGDHVFGAVSVARLGGASAEFAVLRFWARKPPSMPWAQAGAAGTSIETATRALDALDVREGSTLLIDGAAGGVGSVAVQLAIARGARVIGTGRPENQAFITELGATPLPSTCPRNGGPGLRFRHDSLPPVVRMIRGVSSPVPEAPVRPLIEAGLPNRAGAAGLRNVDAGSWCRRGREDGTRIGEAPPCTTRAKSRSTWAWTSARANTTPSG
jgi:alcohol dehydrogenase-like protein